MGFMKIASKVINKLFGNVQMCSAVIAAAGMAYRMNGDDKLFKKINGIPVIVHTLKAFQNCDKIFEIIVVTREDSVDKVKELCAEYGISKVSKIVLGGSTRSESVLNGITAISKKASLVAIHDAARPCVENSIIEEAIVKANKFKAAAPGIPITSTIKKVKDGLIVKTVDRESLVEIQTPQVFDADLIKGALSNVKKKSLAITDDCMAVELLGVNVYTTEGSRDNVKLTTREDFGLVETILSRRGTEVEPHQATGKVDSK